MNGAHLTPRMLDVLYLVGLKKLPYRKVAMKLDLTENTVRKYVQRTAAELPGTGQPHRILMRFVDTLDDRQIKNLRYNRRTG